jgi:hypothetical protein
MMRILLAITCIVMMTTMVNAQFKNLKLEDGEGGSIAINKKDPKNLVAVTNGGTVYYSVDAGLSWKKTKVESAAGVHGQPQIVTDDKDNFFIIHTSVISGVQRLVIHESKDKGATWSADEFIDDDEETLSKDQRWFHVSVDSKGALHATWTQSDVYASADTSCQSVIFYSESSNGKKWSTPKKISQNGHCIEDASLLVGSSSGVSVDGKVFASWANDGKIFFDRSFNGGERFLSMDIKVDDQTGGWNYPVAGIKNNTALPQLAVDYSKGPMSGSIFIVWADKRGGNSDVWFTRSYNGGDNWTQAFKIGDDQEGKDQFLPSMAVDQTTGYVYIVYFDRKGYDDNQTDVVLAYSSDGGTNFGTTKISETSFTPTTEKPLGNFISIAAHKGVITPIWTRIDDGKTTVITAVIKQTDLIKPVANKK